MKTSTDHMRLIPSQWWPFSSFPALQWPVSHLEVLPFSLPLLHPCLRVSVFSSSLHPLPPHHLPLLQCTVFTKVMLFLTILYIQCSLFESAIQSGHWVKQYECVSQWNLHKCSSLKVNYADTTSDLWLTMPTLYQLSHQGCLIWELLHSFLLMRHDQPFGLCMLQTAQVQMNTFVTDQYLRDTSLSKSFMRFASNHFIVWIKRYKIWILYIKSYRLVPLRETSLSNSSGRFASNHFLHLS